VLFEIDCQRVELSPVRVRWHILRHWHRRVGSKKHVISQLIVRDGKACALCLDALDGDIHVDHIKTVKEFAEDLTITLTDAILQCWTIENLRLTHGAKCNLRRRSQPDEHE
jgi:hypothetical protein